MERILESLPLPRIDLAYKLNDTAPQRETKSNSISVQTGDTCIHILGHSVGNALSHEAGDVALPDTNELTSDSSVIRTPGSKSQQHMTHFAKESDELTSKFVTPRVQEHENAVTSLARPGKTSDL